jgi:hypothetical protein
MAHSITISFSEWLNRHLDFKFKQDKPEITQKEMAARIPIAASELGYLLQGKTLPTERTLSKLKSALLLSSSEVDEARRIIAADREQREQESHPRLSEALPPGLPNDHTLHRPVYVTVRREELQALTRKVEALSLDADAKKILTINGHLGDGRDYLLATLADQIRNSYYGEGEIPLWDVSLQPFWLRRRVLHPPPPISAEILADELLRQMDQPSPQGHQQKSASPCLNELVRILEELGKTAAKERKPKPLLIIRTPWLEEIGIDEQNQWSEPIESIQVAIKDLMDQLGKGVTYLRLVVSFPVNIYSEYADVYPLNRLQGKGLLLLAEQQVPEIKAIRDIIKERMQKEQELPSLTVDAWSLVFGNIKRRLQENRRQENGEPFTPEQIWKDETCRFLSRPANLTTLDQQTKQDEVKHLRNLYEQFYFALKPQERAVLFAASLYEDDFTAGDIGRIFTGWYPTHEDFGWDEEAKTKICEDRRNASEHV